MSVVGSKGTLTVGAATHVVEAEKWVVYARVAELAPLAALLKVQADAMVAAIEAAKNHAVKKDATAWECRVMVRQAVRAIDRIEELVKVFSDDAALTALMAAAKAEGSPAYEQYLFDSEKDEARP